MKGGYAGQGLKGRQGGGLEIVFGQKVKTSVKGKAGVGRERQGLERKRRVVKERQGGQRDRYGVMAKAARFEWRSRYQRQGTSRERWT